MIVVKNAKGETRMVADGIAYRLEPGESIVPGGIREKHADKIDIIAKDNMIGVGDLVDYITTRSRFKQWWNWMHKGDCLPCQKRQATLNYIKFKGPKWVADELAKMKAKGK